MTTEGRQCHQPLAGPHYCRLVAPTKATGCGFGNAVLRANSFLSDNRGYSNKLQIFSRFCAKIVIKSLHCFSSFIQFLRFIPTSDHPMTPTSIFLLFSNTSVLPLMILYMTGKICLFKHLQSKILLLFIMPSKMHFSFQDA